MKHEEGESIGFTCEFKVLDVNTQSAQRHWTLGI